jgi:hypothetical protein
MSIDFKAGFKGETFFYYFKFPFNWVNYYFLHPYDGKMGENKYEYNDVCVGIRA